MGLSEQSQSWLFLLLILAPLTTLIIGSQTRSDARFVAGLVSSVFGLVALGYHISQVGEPTEPSKDWASRLFFFGFLGAIGLGFIIAVWRDRTHRTELDIFAEPIPPDDELF